MAIVLDASAALPWCFRDEATSGTDRLLAMAAAGMRLYVPAHWPAEILNGLVRAKRRGRIDLAGIQQFLIDLQDLDIYVDERSFKSQWSEELPLAEIYSLSAYDAAYLSLAKNSRFRSRPSMVACVKLQRSNRSHSIPNPSEHQANIISIGRFRGYPRPTRSVRLPAYRSQ
jgi:predicted nucleic acid-binding protein